MPHTPITTSEDHVDLWREQFERYQDVTDKWRVSIYANGKLILYNDYRIEAFADRWADDMRTAYRRVNAHNIFVKKEKIA